MAEGLNIDQPVNRRLRLGIVGIGVGASEILPQMEAMPDIQLVAAAITVERLRLRRQRPGTWNAPGANAVTLLVFSLA